jgi:hypothetical protein
MKGAIQLDKKQKISWGVSFGSLALVAGMVSYLGLSNGDKTNNQINIQTNSNNPFQQSQGSLGNQSNQNDSSGQSFSNDPSSQFNQSKGSSQFTQDDGYANNNFDNNSQFSGGSDQQGQFSGSGGAFGHHHGFDTTTGGT